MLLPLNRATRETFLFSLRGNIPKSVHLAGGGGGDQATSEGKSGASGAEKSRTSKKKAGAASALVTARGHHSPAFGVVCGALGIEEDEAARAFMFLVARDVLSAATRYVVCYCCWRCCCGCGCCWRWRCCCNLNVQHRSGLCKVTFSIRTGDSDAFHGHRPNYPKRGTPHTWNKIKRIIRTAMDWQQIINCGNSHGRTTPQKQASSQSGELARPRGSRRKDQTGRLGLPEQLTRLSNKKLPTRLLLEYQMSACLCACPPNTLTSRFACEIAGQPGVVFQRVSVHFFVLFLYIIMSGFSFVVD